MCHLLYSVKQNAVSMVSMNITCPFPYLPIQGQVVRLGTIVMQDRMLCLPCNYEERNHYGLRESKNTKTLSGASIVYSQNIWQSADRHLMGMGQAENGLYGHRGKHFLIKAPRP